MKFSAKSHDMSVRSSVNAGELAVALEFQHLVCLCSDGRLLIATGHEHNPFVQSYIARLSRLGLAFRREVVDVSVVRAAYGRDEKALVNIDHTPMQTRAKELLSTASRSRASDIHVRVQKNACEVFFRIHNDLVKVSGHSREYGERLLATLYAAMTDVSDASYKPHERQDARIGDPNKLPSQLHGVRIATTPTVDGSLMVMRLLYDDTSASQDPRTLGFSESHAELLRNMKEQPTGMNIISGPTGSGKSTTLQRLLSGLIAETEHKLHVITVEDPPEYPIAGAVQTPVTNAAGEVERKAAFSEAIANSLRLDPDTIMIGEMRDLPSAQLCLRAAMTGHQVWTTVHANNALSVIDRLYDLGLPLAMIADPKLVTGLIAQRLVKVLCPNCRRPLKEELGALDARLVARLKAVSADMIDQCFVQGEGCTQCRGFGTTGRTVVAEIIVPDEEFCRYIRAGEKQKAHECWTHRGGITCVEHAIDKVMAGLVDPRMAERVVGHLRREEGRPAVVKAHPLQPLNGTTLQAHPGLLAGSGSPAGQAGMQAAVMGASATSLAGSAG